MISFDGVDIRSVAPVKIVDILPSAVSLETTAKGRAITGGSDFVRTHDGSRTVSVSFAILEENPIQRAMYMDALRRWAKRDAEYRLEIAFMPNMYLQAVCTGFPDHSIRQWWESGLQLTFTCFDNPYWTSKGEKSVACGTEFTVLGDAPPLMRIENTFDSSASNQAYSDGTNTMTFSTIPAGNMVIDLNRQTAVVGSSSITQYYAYTSRFLLPKTGKQTITGTGTVKYRERWV